MKSVGLEDKSDAMIQAYGDKAYAVVQNAMAGPNNLKKVTGREFKTSKEALQFLLDNEKDLKEKVGDVDVLTIAGEKKRALDNFNDSFMDELENGDGLIGGNDFYRELIDWPMNERDGYESAGVSLVPNCMRYSALTCMAELTGIAEYSAKAEKLKQQILQKMSVEGRLVDSPGSTHTARHSIFFPVATGVIAPDAVPELSKLDIRCSVYAVQFLLDALYMGNYGQQALELLRSVDTVVLDKTGTVTSMPL